MQLDRTNLISSNSHESRLICAGRKYKLLTNLQEAQELFAILDRDDYSNCASFLQASTAQEKVNLLCT